MARKPIDIGIIGNDGTGDSIRDAFRKVNDNFREVYSAFGIGDSLTFVGLDDTPTSYSGQANSLLTVNSLTTGVAFKKLQAGTGIEIDFTTNENSIILNSLFATISGDPAPNLGGPVNAQYGSARAPIGNTVDLSNISEITQAKVDMQMAHGTVAADVNRFVANKGYVDTKIAKSGVSSIDPGTGNVDSSWGTMTGPLVLSNDPILSDDIVWNGKTAATKHYVDNSGYSSRVNLYVATSGNDHPQSISNEQRGRSLAFAYKTIEQALKHAEEIIIASPININQYAKTLTYNNGSSECYITDIDTAPIAGAGFNGIVHMSVDTINIQQAGSLYLPGEIVTLVGGTSTHNAQFEVLSVNSIPGTNGRGSINTIKLLTGGVYSSLPGSLNIQTLQTEFGSGATVNVTYKVNHIEVVNGGSNYELISVRTTGGGGIPAFGKAILSSGVITSIELTNQGNSFTSLPTILVNLPRLYIQTEGFRTDFTGNVTTNTPGAIQSRDIRDGMLLKGVRSGALAQILVHTGELSTDSVTVGSEIFDIDILHGEFEINEPIMYSPSTKDIQVTVLVETGTYYESLPLRLPQNVSIVGIDANRTIIQPKVYNSGSPMGGISSSPWAYAHFRRDAVIDSLTTSEHTFGYQYLTINNQPVYPLINNAGNKTGAANLIRINREFIKYQTINWLKNRSINNISPFSSSTNYDINNYIIAIENLIDAASFDLQNGSYNRSVSSALKLYTESNLFNILNTQLSALSAIISFVYSTIQTVCNNVKISELYLDNGTLASISSSNLLKIKQIVNFEFISDVSSIDTLESFESMVIDIINNSGSVNFPKDNYDNDVFLCNDGSGIQGITVQGHNSFMAVLDSECQILTKIPHCYESVSISKSTGRRVFAGGMFIDGFTGNQQFKIANLISPTILEVNGLLRTPKTPCSFIVNGSIYRVNYIRNYTLGVTSPEYSTAHLILDDATPYYGNESSQSCTFSNSSGTLSIVTAIDNNLYPGATVRFSSTGALPSNIEPNTDYFILLDNFTKFSFRITELQYSKTPIGFVSTGSGTISVDQVFEILTPGNRSFSSHNFSQINDLGYGVIAANGSAVDVISMSSTYCHISQYAVNGGQINSSGSTSSYGNYGLVAEGANPLEVPTPVELYRDIAQSITVVSDSIIHKNTKGGTVLYALYSKYLPLVGSELEVNHGNAISTYQVSSVEYVIHATIHNLCKITLLSSSGLVAGIPNSQIATIRQNNFLVVTGDITSVSTRPSTALLLNESTTVYRVLNFEDYNNTYDKDVFVIMSINTTTGVFTTNIPHLQRVGYQIKIKLGSGDTLPTAINPVTDTSLGTIYYISTVPGLNQFTLTTINGGPAINLTGGPEYTGSLISTMVPYGLTLTQLKETYNNININVYKSQPFQTPASLIPCTVSATTPAIITSTGHPFTAGSMIRFSGSLPTGIGNTHYWVVSLDLDADSFKVASIPPIFSTQMGVDGILTVGTTTTISNLISTAGFEIGMSLVPQSSIQIGYIDGNGTTATATFVGNGRIRFLVGQQVSISGTDDTGFNDATATILSVTVSSITYANSTVGTSLNGTITPVSSGSLGASATVVSIDSPTTLTISAPGASSGTVVFTAEGVPVGASTTGTNVKIGAVIGAGLSFAVVPLSITNQARVVGSKFVYDGTEHTIASYTVDPLILDYAIISVTSPIFSSVAYYNNPITLKSAVSAGTVGAKGSLAIRIALINATSHNFTEIGTGSYADTNYPHDLFGKPINDYLSVPQWATAYDTNGIIIPKAQVQERNVGRAFFVTSDQDGKFAVGSYLHVDQGTGAVSFNASIELSQLSGLGFSRGVTINEFSVDDSMTDGANDTVPTEAAIQGYINKRLGITQLGVIVPADTLIPAGNAGGFMSLSGQLAMKANMNLGNNKIENLAAPSALSDAARLDSINITNLKDVSGSTLLSFNNKQAGQILGLTGINNTVSNFTATGDISFGFTSGDVASNIIRSYISPSVILDSHINNSASISQQKLNLTSAFTRSSATGITQSEKGIASFDSAQFVATNGWISVKDNGIQLSKLEVLGSKRVLGNSTVAIGAVSSISFTDVVSDGGAIKKSQFSSGVGYLKRINSTVGAFTDDAHYSIINDDTTKVANTLVRRDNNGDFSSREITIDALKVKPTSLPQYTSLKGNEITTLSGSTDLYGFGGSFVGLSIGFGTLTADNKSLHNNTSHEFRNQTGVTTFATIDNTGLNLGSRALTTTAITTGSATTAGTITGQWILADTPGGSTRTNSRLQSTYSADLAEYYEGDTEYEVGTVLIFGGSHEVTISNSYADTKVAGVVSNNAAYSMYGACPGYKNLIALQGRVPCKVIGRVCKGDILVTSYIPGVAISAVGAAKAGTMIGKALSDYDSTTPGLIEVAVGRT